MNNKEIKKYNKKGRLIYYKSYNDWEVWQEFNKNDKLIHWKTSNGYENWFRYDENNNLIYSKNIKGDENWYKYDESGNKTNITEEILKEKNKFTRFEIMDI